VKKFRLFLLTGTPGVGKTTVVMKVIARLRNEGFSIGGICSREMREGRRRSGFIMIDLLTGFEAELASMTGEGPRLGRFRVNLENLSKFASRAVISAEGSDVAVVDEIGPMELISPEFRRAVEHLLASSVPALLVVHKTMKDPLVEGLKGRTDSLLYDVTFENREALPDSITSRLVENLRG
jgi:nucleoside-triphosphatase